MLIIKYETTGEDIHSFLKYVLIRTELSNKKKIIQFLLTGIKWTNANFKRKITQTKLIFKKLNCSKILYLHSVLLIKIM